MVLTVLVMFYVNFEIIVNMFYITNEDINENMKVEELEPWSGLKHRNTNYTKVVNDRSIFSEQNLSGFIKPFVPNLFIMTA